MFYHDFDLEAKSDDENEQRLQRLMPAWYAETRLTKLREHWSNLVSRYLATNLIYETDRVMALNGVTEAVQKLTGFAAVCGFWLETFVADICWVRTLEASDKKSWDLSFEVVLVVLRRSILRTLRWIEHGNAILDSTRTRVVAGDSQGK
jgi:hypothetical protein